MGVGPKDARGILVGESPSQEDVETGQPISGATGSQLAEELMEQGLRRSQLFVVTATACAAPRGCGEKDRQLAVEACRGALRQQINGRWAKPKLLMGKMAAFAIHGVVKGVMQRRGFLRGNTIVTWNPSYAFFRNPYEWGAFLVDLGRFKRMIDGTLAPLPEDRDLIIEPRLSDLRKLVKESQFLAVDVETKPAEGDEEGFTGKDPTRARLRTVGLSNESWGISTAWPPTAKGLADGIAAVLKDERILKVGANYTWFDDRVLKRYGMETRNYHDVRDMRRALSSTSQLSLAYITSLYVDFPPWKEMEDDDK